MTIQLSCRNNNIYLVEQNRAIDFTCIFKYDVSIPLDLRTQVKRRKKIQQRKVKTLNLLTEEDLLRFTRHFANVYGKSLYDLFHQVEGFFQ